MIQPLDKLLDKYIDIRQAMERLEKARRLLEKSLVKRMEYGEKPIYKNNCRISKTLTIRYVYPKEYADFTRERRGELWAEFKRKEMGYRKAGQFEQKEVYGIKWEAGKRFTDSEE